MRPLVAWIVAAWAMYLTAWALPVHADGVRLPEGLPGWEAFRFAASPVWPYEGISFESFGTWYGAVLAALSASTNFVMLGSVWAVFRPSRIGLHLLGWACVGGFLVNAHWCMFDAREALRDLCIGYFLWWWSFLPVAIGVLKLGRQAAQ